VFSLVKTVPSTHPRSPHLPVKYSIIIAVPPTSMLTEFFVTLGMRVATIFFLCFFNSLFSQIAPNKAFDTLKESIKVTSYEKGTNKFLSADHHYCLENNQEFQIHNGKSVWPFRMEDALQKKMSIQLDNIKFARKGYLPLLYKVKRPVYNKKENVYLERLVKDSIYEMENIFFKPDLTVDEKASGQALFMYKNYLVGNQLLMRIEIKDIHSLYVISEGDKKKAANNLKVLLGCNYCISINIQSEGKEINNTVVFKVLKL
jgi:hypothetical protein